MQRFKKEREFLNEYKENWRSYTHLGNAWNSPQMDWLFNRVYLPTTDYRASITPNMLITIPKDQEDFYKEQMLKYDTFPQRITRGTHPNTMVYISYQPEDPKKPRIGFYILPTITGNCQMCSIMYFDALLNSCAQKEVLKVLTYIQQEGYNGYKQLFYFDINRRYRSALEGFTFKRKPCDYDSTNGSEMMDGIIFIPYK